MKGQAKAQDPLDIEVDRHPMWSTPRSWEEVQADGGRLHVYVLRCQIAKALKPFDGRPKSEFIVEFCKQVHRVSASENAILDPFSMIGEIVVLGVGMREKLTRFADHCQPVNRSSYLQESGVVERLTTEFTEVVAKTLV